MTTRPFTDREMAKVRAELRTGIYKIWERAVAEMAFSSGPRMSEILPLSVGDIHRPGAPGTDQNGIVRRFRLTAAQQKAGNPREVPFDAITRLCLAAHVEALPDRSPTAPLFPGQSRAGTISVATVRRLFLRICLNAGILPDEIGSHTARKSFVTRIWHASGHDLVLTMALSGHRDPVSLLRYIGVPQEKIDATAAALEQKNRDDSAKLAQLRAQAELEASADPQAHLRLSPGVPVPATREQLRAARIAQRLGLGATLKRRTLLTRRDVRMAAARRAARWRHGLPLAVVLFSWTVLLLFGPHGRWHDGRRCLADLQRWSAPVVRAAQQIHLAGHKLVVSRNRTGGDATNSKNVE